MTEAKGKVVKIQRRKTGEVVQCCDVYVGRACRMGGWNLQKSKWHNPYHVVPKKKQEAYDFKKDEFACKSAKEAVEKFETYLLENKELLSQVGELKGKVLGCWCKKRGTEPCHADILLKLANKAV